MGYGDDGTNFTNPPPGPAAAPDGAGQWRDVTSYGGTANGANLANQRFQGMGAAAAQRQAYNANYGGFNSSMSQADASRNSQGDALNLMKTAAYGTAPSQAQLLGQNMIDQSINAGQSMAASARGGSLAQAAAQRQAANAAIVQQQQGTNQLAAMRAQEMAQARGDYMAGASGMRAGDYQGAQVNLGKTAQDIQNEQFQRGLNQQGEMGYEQLGQNAELGQMGAMGGEHKLAESGYETQAQVGQHSQDRDTGVIGSVVGAIGGGLGSIFSDMRAKTDVVPLDAAPGTADYMHAMGGSPSLDGAAGRDPSANPFAAPGPTAGAPAAKPGFGATFGKFLGGAFGGGPSGGAPPGGGYFPMRSDAMAKTNIMDPGGMEKLGPSGGMDVMGSLKAGSNFATTFGKNPGGNPTMFSDDRTKLAEAWDDGQASTIQSVEQLAAMPPAELKQHPSQLAAVVRNAKANAWSEGNATPPPGAAGIRVGGHVNSPREDLEASRARVQSGQYEPSEIMSAHDVPKYIRDVSDASQYKPMADANRALAPSAYSYKPEFTPPDQKPGEKNVGPMAQNMASNPVASTAVYKDPSTGLLAIDRDKALKLGLGGVGALQEQQDETDRKVDGLAAALAKKMGIGAVYGASSRMSR